MKKLFDLRFVIGLFFITVGLLLVIYHLMNKGTSGTVNMISGLVYAGFGAFMMILSYTGKATDEPTTGE